MCHVAAPELHGIVEAAPDESGERLEMRRFGIRACFRSLMHAAPESDPRVAVAEFAGPCWRLGALLSVKECGEQILISRALREGTWLGGTSMSEGSSRRRQGRREVWQEGDSEVGRRQ